MSSDPKYVAMFDPVEVHIDEPPQAIIFDPASIVERLAFQVGARLFKTRWGAARHCAKIELLREIEIEARAEMMANHKLWSNFMEEDTKAWLFRKKYRYGGNDTGYNGFAEAVSVRAREILKR